MSIYGRTEVYLNWFTFTCPSCGKYLVVNFGEPGFPDGNAKFGVKCCFCENVFAVGFVVEAYKEPLPENEKISNNPLPKISNIVISGVTTETPINPVRASLDQSSNQRADVKNPNNPAFRAAINNRSNQMNPNNPVHRSSRSRG